MIKVAFDIDGCLIDNKDKPRENVVELLKSLKRNGCYVIVWSGGGQSYAEHHVRRLFLEDSVDEAREKILGGDPEYKEGVVDLAIDDEDVKYGTVNIRV